MKIYSGVGYFFRVPSGQNIFWSHLHWSKKWSNLISHGLISAHGLRNWNPVFESIARLSKWDHRKKILLYRKGCAQPGEFCVSVCPSVLVRSKSHGHESEGPFLGGCSTVCEKVKKKCNLTLVWAHLPISLKSTTIWSHLRICGHIRHTLPKVQSSQHRFFCWKGCLKIIGWFNIQGPAVKSMVVHLAVNNQRPPSCQIWYQ